MSYFMAPLRAKLRHAPSASQRQRGLSLVELMIAITLGMVAVAGAISIYLANRSSYKLVEAVARVQENARFAVEFLGRDLREAGGIVCGGSLVQENVVLASYPTSTHWWSDWSAGLTGYDASSTFVARTTGTNSGDQKSGTDAIVVWSASTASPSVISAYDAGTSTFTVYPAQTAASGKVFTACDDTRVSTFTLAQDASTTVQAAQAPTNAIKTGGFVNQLNASAWYIGVGGSSSSTYSLWRAGLVSAQNTAADSAPAQEILENVTDMQITYLQGDGNGAPTGTDYVAASAVTNWANVLAVRVVLTLATPDSVGLSTSGASQALTQDFPFTVAIRRRLK